MINREIKVKKVSEVRDPVTVWDTVLKNSSYTWYLGGYYYHTYAVIYSKSADRLIKDDSFFVYENGELCGLVILVFTLSDEFDGIQGAYYSHPLPWPIIMDHVKDRDNIESFIFEKIDSRAKSFGAGKVQLCLNQPESNANCEKKYFNVVRKFRYVDQSFYSHAINVTGETLSYVRKRYKRYVKKNWDKFEIRIIDQKKYYSDISIEYMSLHVKDSGKVHRPIETFQAQLELINQGEGFVVQVIDKTIGVFLGMLMVVYNKNSAYDFSVAVDPDYKNEYVSHLMKWKTIQHLQEIGIKYYELGLASTAASYLFQPSDKNYGISHFKDGWARGQFKKVFLAEKYFDIKSLEKSFEKKLFNAIKYFEIK